MNRLLPDGANVSHLSDRPRRACRGGECSGNAETQKDFGPEATIPPRTTKRTARNRFHSAMQQTSPIAGVVPSATVIGPSSMGAAGRRQMTPGHLSITLNVPQ